MFIDIIFFTATFLLASSFKLDLSIASLSLGTMLARLDAMDSIDFAMHVLWTLFAL
jgi:hypothetical protein